MKSPDELKRAYEAANAVYQKLAMLEMDSEKNTIVPYDVCVEMLDQLAFHILPVLFDASEETQ